jgi:hypothetical protein
VNKTTNGMVIEAEIGLSGFQYLVSCRLGEYRVVDMQIELNSKQLEI